MREIHEAIIKGLRDTLTLPTGLHFEVIKNGDFWKLRAIAENDAQLFLVRLEPENLHVVVWDQQNRARLKVDLAYEDPNLIQTIQACLDKTQTIWI